MEPDRNLLILHSPGCQNISDWLDVKTRIEADAPDIDVRIGDNDTNSMTTREWQISRPSLVFSPLHLKNYVPAGGKIYVGKPFGKIEQYERLITLGIPVPQFVKLNKFAALDPKIWGDYVVVKPNRGSLGRGVHLAKSADVARHFGHLADRPKQMMIQQFIDHTDDQGHLYEYRILLMFGEPLYFHRNRWSTPRRPLGEIEASVSNDIASNTNRARVRSLCYEPDVLALAKAVAPAFPEVPTLGVDIVRERATGRLFVLEVNPGGNTWHFSSRVVTLLPSLRDETYRQYNALEKAAKLLIEKTRTEAL